MPLDFVDALEEPADRLLGLLGEGDNRDCGSAVGETVRARDFITGLVAAMERKSGELEADLLSSVCFFIFWYHSGAWASSGWTGNLSPPSASALALAVSSCCASWSTLAVAASFQSCTIDSQCLKDCTTLPLKMLISFSTSPCRSMRPCSTTCSFMRFLRSEMHFSTSPWTKSTSQARTRRQTFACVCRAGAWTSTKSGVQEDPISSSCFLKTGSCRGGSSLRKTLARLRLLSVPSLPAITLHRVPVRTNTYRPRQEGQL
mmetsp:Transcript_66794/g.175115  ORF Transcript_66794/g.175115 Transcript_66794/m.175115 type:complete len:260 (-) Transcript_66794:25-804(-)